MIEKAFDYKCRGSNSLAEGVVFAVSPELAYRKLEQMGFQPLNMPKVNWRVTLQSLGTEGFDKKSLAVFYKTMGRAVTGKRAIDKALADGVQYVSDAKLKQSVQMAAQLVRNGQKLSNAMLSAGFRERDVRIMEAAEKAGSLGDVLARLSQELELDVALTRGIKASLRTPIFTIFLIYAMSYAAMMFVVPLTAEKIIGNSTSGSSKLPGWVDTIYGLSGTISKAPVISTVLYVAFAIGVILFVRSKIFKKLIDKIGIVNNISMKKDLSQTWNSFALLLNAGVPVYSIAEMASKSAEREDNKNSYRSAFNSLKSGIKLKDAIEKAGFPDYVVVEVSAAASSGDTTEGLHEMANRFADEVKDLTSILQEKIKVWSTMIVALFLVGFVFVTYMPLFITVMSQL